MDNVYDTDVLIIGAGLAGSTLAFRLRQHGLRVILAERGRLATLDKLCAGALDESVGRSFDGVYGPGSLGSIGPHTARWRTSSCVGASVRGDASFATVPRKRLDDYCRARAVGASARRKRRKNFWQIAEEEGYKLSDEELRGLSGGFLECHPFRADVIYC